MVSRFLSAVAVVAVLAGLLASSGGSSATPGLLAGSPQASPKASPVESSPLLATMQAKQSATADAKTATAVIHAGETATAQAAANAQATGAALTATAAVGTVVANAVAVAAENAQLQTAIVGAATSEAEAEQAAATDAAGMESANATGTAGIVGAQATIDAQATEIAGLYLTETVIALPTATPTATPVPTETPTPTDTATPTATATPVPQAGDVLYAAGKKRLKEWQTSQDWKYVDGMLVNDGSNHDRNTWLKAPFAPGAIADYAVEVQIQFVRNEGSHGSNFGIVVRATDAGGYWAGIKDAKAGVAAGSEAFYDYSVGLDAGAGFNPGSEWHTYRVEVKGNTIRLLIDGTEIVKTTDNRFLEGGAVGLFSSLTQINVRSFKIIML